MTDEEKDAALQAAKNEVEGYKGRLGEYERMLMSPDYLEYVAAKQRGDDPGHRTNGEVRREPAEKVDLDSLKPSQLAEHIINRVGQVVDGRLQRFETERLVPLTQDQINAQAVAEVKAAADAHPDFEDLKPAIMNEIKKTPKLSVEDAYILAKAKTVKRPAAPRKPTGEPPTGGSGTKSKTPAGFESKFLEAYRAAGLPEPGG